MNYKKITKFTKRTRHQSHLAAHHQVATLAAQAHHHHHPLANVTLQREAVHQAAAAHQVTLAHHLHHLQAVQVQAHQVAQALLTQALPNPATQTLAKASTRKDQT